MDPTFESKRQELLNALTEESYLSLQQRDELERIVRGTVKPLVLSMVEDLLQRLLVTRAENFLLITRKIQQSLRAEKRRMNVQEETQANKVDAATIQNLLERI